jgi:hypothetical protein
MIGVQEALFFTAIALVIPFAASMVFLVSDFIYPNSWGERILAFVAAMLFIAIIGSLLTAIWWGVAL